MRPAGARGKRAWLWVAVTSMVTVCVVRLSRGADVARALLGEECSGTLVTDRYSAYNWYPVQWRQVCWAHLLRDFAAMRGRGGRSNKRGDALLAQAPQMFTWWHRVRDGTLKRSSFGSVMTPCVRKWSDCWKQAVAAGYPRPPGCAKTF